MKINHLLLKPASFCIIVGLSAWCQYELTARYRDQSARGVAVTDGGQHAILPSTFPEASRTTSSKNDTFNGKRAPLLQPSDSFYKKHNISTTPIVIEKYKLLFFAIEKVGSTVFKQLMRRMMGYKDYWAHGDGIPHAFPRNGLKGLSEYSLQEANEMMTSDEWTRAMFVRDPKERALSGFLMWMPQMRLISRKELENARRGLIKESLVKGNLGLGKCCKDQMNGNFNHEVLCIHHMRTFENFLEMVEEPNNIDDGNEEGSGGGRPHNQTAAMIRNLRKSPPCPDKHWSPISQWRMERKFYPALNFVGHLETAQWDTKRLLDRLHPDAWETYGASGWGKHRNESMFESTTTVNHAVDTQKYLFQHYTSKEIERRVEKIYEDDFDNIYLDLERVPVGRAQSFYRKRYLQRAGTSGKQSKI